ncbi:hypothetical protein F5Y10DRAFT_283892 [Nemania abortiva]|nr:hypothetical protein F5Y10DRAFT_283892 [Nemania abortiva]
MCTGSQHSQAETAEKYRTRHTELLAQLKHQDNVREVQELTERSRNLNLSMCRGVAEARQIATGHGNIIRDSNIRGSRDECYTVEDICKLSGRNSGWIAPHDDSDDGHDKSYLTADGKHVIEKEYKLIDGHWALIPYRKELHEVDPHLLAALQEERERELARQWRRKEKKRAKEAGQKYTDNHQESLNIYETKPHRTPGLLERFSGLEPASSVIDGSQNIPIVEEKRMKPRVKRWAPPPRYETPTPPPPGDESYDDEDYQELIDMLRKAEIEEEFQRRTKTSPSPTSFRARAKQNGFNPTEQRGYGSEYDSAYQQPPKAESSTAPTRRVKRESRTRTRVEKFTEDIEYEYADDEADSRVAGHKAPVHGPKRTSKSTSYGKTRSNSYEFDDDESDLDVWLKIADEDDRGRRPIGRLNFGSLGRSNKR